MGAKSRILALKLLEMQKKHPEYSKQMGVDVKVKKTKRKNLAENNIMYQGVVFYD